MTSSGSNTTEMCERSSDADFGESDNLRLPQDLF
jgi:hypothetical protein